MQWTGKGQYITVQLHQDSFCVDSKCVCKFSIRVLGALAANLVDESSLSIHCVPSQLFLPDVGAVRSSLIRDVGNYLVRARLSI